MPQSLRLRSEGLKVATSSPKVEVRKEFTDPQKNPVEKNHFFSFFTCIFFALCYIILFKIILGMNQE